MCRGVRILIHGQYRPERGDVHPRWKRGVCYCMGNHDEAAEAELGVVGLQRAGRACEHMTTRDAWPQAQAHMSENCAVGGRPAEHSRHAIRHGEHALQPKHACRQAQLPGDTSAGRFCWERATWQGRKGSAQHVRVALHAGRERATPEGR